MKTCLNLNVLLARVLAHAVGNSLLIPWLAFPKPLALLFPDRLVRPIADHHNFHEDQPFARSTAVVQLADILCRAEALGRAGDRKIPRLNPAALEILGMAIDDVLGVMERMSEEMRDIRRV